MSTEPEGDRMRRFEDKIVLVTGAARGIGQATAVRLAEEGASVACVDLNVEGLAKTAAKLDAVYAADAGGATYITLECDVGDEAQVKATVAAVIERFERLDVLCNIAGILRSDHTHELSTEAWNTIIRVNLTGAFLFCREALPHLGKKKGSNIVNMASSAALGSHPWMAAYAASKGGLVSMTKAIAAEYVMQGLRANCIAPGGIATPLHGQFRIPEGAKAQLISKAVPFQKYVGPEYVASTVAFLASDDARYMTGTLMRVDGGALASP